MFQSINQSKSVVLGFSAMLLASAVSLPAQAINILQNGDLVPNQTIQNQYTDTQRRIMISTTTGTNSTDIPSWVFIGAGNTADSFLNTYQVLTPTGNAAGKAGEAYGLNLANGQTIESPTGGSGWFTQFDGDTVHGAKMYQQLNNLTAGKNYEVSFYQAAATVNGGPFFNQPTYNQFRVYFGDSTFSNYQTGNQMNMAVGQNVTPWSQQTMTFTASAATQYLLFWNVGGPTGQPPIALLSNISVDDGTPVPWETDTLPLVGSTVLFGLGLWAKNKFAQKKLK